jgi:hypothetical protein
MHGMWRSTPAAGRPRTAEYTSAKSKNHFPNVNIELIALQINCYSIKSFSRRNNTPLEDR